MESQPQAQPQQVQEAASTVGQTVNPELAKLKEVVGNELIKNDGTVISKVTFDEFYNSFSPDGQYLCFYFGAHWAPPSRLFTENLKQKFYSQVNHGKIVVEIIFVTDDRENSHFERNFKKMPWLAIPFDDNHKI